MHLRRIHYKRNHALRTEPHPSVQQVCLGIPRSFPGHVCVTVSGAVSRGYRISRTTAWCPSMPRSLGRLCHAQRTTRACERENSATGHIGFLEFINAAALPFAREPCNINGKAILASIASSVERVPCGYRDPPAFPTHPLPIHPRPARPPGAGQTSLRSEPLNRAVPAGYLRAQPWRGISIAWRGAHSAQLR